MYCLNYEIEALHTVQCVLVFNITCSNHASMRRDINRAVAWFHSQTERSVGNFNIH